MTGLDLGEFKDKIGNGFLVLDTRTEDNFKEGFIPGTVFIGAGERFEEWADNLLSAHDKIILVADQGTEEEIYSRLTQLGFNNIEGYLEGGFVVCQDAQEPIDMIIDVDVDELAMDLPHDPNLIIVDVRKPNEFAEGHIKGAVNLSLTDMTDVALIAQFEETENLYIHSAEGYRSLIACSLLKRQGYHNIRNVNGGWEKIKEDKSFTVEKEPSMLN